ncbi:MAG: bifunctional 3,4-dihydroxy-2-butanone-4-phosphate synthase/GTP cyclohydrolase II [Gammaproteobacteria bacterium]|nr:bifunctional 3,4-dihydroxy-2-butanone-4-phosphate synthase/GTP cyclohydrolase II [Gammaproteobacteria bacterium]
MNSIEEILEDLQAGRMVVIVDDEDRENEGDLLMAATLVRPEDINFMARYGRGLICLTLNRQRCQQLRLPLMVSETDGRQGTNFTLSIEAAEGVTTGISAHDRAQTIKAAVSPDAKPDDLRQPGHIFPIMAQPGGVLNRAGHTEAGCDLARLAGLDPSAVIVEILNEDGSMARRPDLERFANEHRLKMGTIADLISYRLRTEHSIERILERQVQTSHGDFLMVCYEDHVNRNVHFALIKGEIGGDQPTLVRVHLQDSLGDVVGLTGSEFGWPLPSAMERIDREGSGVLVILRHGENPGAIIETLRNIGKPAPDKPAGDSRVLRTYGTGAQILRDLGVSKMRVMSAPRQLHGLSGFGLEIVGYVDDEQAAASA